MRPLLILALLAPSLAACGDDASPVFADFFWRVRCEGMGGCAPNIENREIIATNGEEGHSVTCTLQDLGDTYNLNFSAFQGTAYGIGARNVVFPKTGGGVTGTSCSVNLREQNNRYEGGCSAAPPTEMCRMDPGAVSGWMCPSPCQVSATFAEEMDGPTVRVSVLCAGIGLTADPQTVVEVASPDDMTMPATLRLVNCPTL